MKKTVRILRSGGSDRLSRSQIATDGPLSFSLSLPTGSATVELALGGHEKNPAYSFSWTSDTDIMICCGQSMQRAVIEFFDNNPPNIWFVDKLFVSIAGKQHYLWRAVDQDGDVLDILIQRRQNQVAAERFFRRVLESQGQEPRRAVTDGLRSYVSAIRNVLPSTVHDRTKFANNRAENSHQRTCRRERQMQRFKSSRQAQRFLGLHARVGNLFRYGRHLMSARHHRLFCERAFTV